VVVAMANSFDPFPSQGHVMPDAASIPPRNPAVLNAPAVGGPEDDAASATDEVTPAPATATGFVVSNDGWIVTTSSAVQNCRQILIGSYGEAQDLRMGKDIPVAAVRLQNADTFLPLSFSLKPPGHRARVLAMGLAHDDPLGRQPTLTAGAFRPYA